MKAPLSGTLLEVYNEEVNGEPGNYGSGFLGLRQPGSR